MPENDRKLPPPPPRIDLLGALGRIVLEGIRGAPGLLVVVSLAGIAAWWGALHPESDLHALGIELAHWSTKVVGLALVSVLGVAVILLGLAVVLDKLTLRREALAYFTAWLAGERPEPGLHAVAIAIIAGATTIGAAIVAAAVFQLPFL